MNINLLDCLSLYLLPFLHEDVAIIAGAYFVHEHALPPWLAAGCLYAGMVMGDAAIYGLGAAARRIPRLRDWFIRERAERARLQLSNNLVGAICACRVVPGLLFPTFVVCGWLGVRFRRFLLTAMMATGVYLAIVFPLVLLFGGAVVQWLGSRGWVILVVLAVVLAIRGLMRPAYNIFADLVTGWQRTQPMRAAFTRLTHRGMPPLGALLRRVAPAERIPATLFYVPLGLRWLWLGLRQRCLTLPALANPNIEAGGLWGESKSRCMHQVGPDQSEWIAPFVTLTRSTERGPEAVAADVRKAVTAVTEAGLSLPLVVKPDVGWQGYGVRVIDGEESLSRYLEAFPRGKRLLLQRLVPFDGEVGILYVRMPGEETGRVVSMTFRYFPYVVGDGVSRVRDLMACSPRTSFKSRFLTGGDRAHRGLTPEKLESVPAEGEVVRLAFIGSIRVGGLYRDARDHITPELSARIDGIARSMPNFHFGRFDVRFESVEALREGRAFQIIEINGAGSEAIHVWDPQTPLRRAYRELIDYQSLIFDIGRRNRERGFKPISFARLMAFTWSQHRLLVRYPPSE